MCRKFVYIKSNYSLPTMSDSDKKKDIMSFEELHNKTILLLEKNKDDVPEYCTLIQNLNKLYERGFEIDNNMTRYIFLLYLGLESIQNYSWIKENEFLFGR